MDAPFYVYVHRRPDTGLPFYVGKGCGARARVRQHRNPYWRNVVAKAGEPTIEIAADGLDEELAHLVEVELIAKCRNLGIALTNLTDGGEGMSGFRKAPESIERGAAAQRGQKRPTVSAALMGRPKTPEHRAKLAAAKIGKAMSEEARAAMSAARRGKPSPLRGRKHHPDTIQKIKAAALRGERNPFFGKKPTPEVTEKIRAANIGRKDSDETRLRKSQARRGSKNPNFGKSVSEARKQKQIATLMSRARLVCQHCSKSANEGNFKRWHGDNCRSKV